MKSRYILALLVACFLLAAPHASVAQNYTRLQPDTITGTIDADGDSLTMTSERVGGFGSIKIQTMDSYTGTWEVQCSVNGTTFDTDNELALSLVDNTTTVYSVDDTIGIWTVANASGCRSVRVIATAGFAASDTVVTISATQTGGAGGGGAGGGGGGAVSITDGVETAAVSAGNELLVSCADCSGSGVSHIDDAAFAPTTDDVVPIAGAFDDTTPDGVNEGDAGILRMSGNRNLYTTLRDAAGNERGANVTAQNELLVELGAGAASIGTLGANSGVDIGDVTIDNATLAVTQSGTWDEVGINDSGNSITVDGTITVTDGAGALNVIVDSASLGTVTVAGTITANLSATDNAVLDDIADGIAVTGSGSFTVTDGAGSLNVICDSGCSGGTQYLEDAVHSSGDTGTVALVVRNDAGTALAADGDNIPLMVNSAGALYVATHAVTQSGTWDEVGINDSGNSITVDGTVTVTDGAGALNVIVDSSASLTVTDGAGALNVICDSGCSGGTQYAEDAVHASGNTGTLALVVRNDAGTALAADGDNIPLMVNSAGALYVASHAVTATNLDVQIGGSDTLTVTDGSGAMNVIIDSSASLTVTDGAGAMNVIIDSGTTAVTNAGTFAVQSVEGAGTLLTNSTTIAGDTTDIEAAVELIDNAVSGAGFNITQLNGVNVSMGTGVVGTGVQRTTLATDDLAVTNSTLIAANTLSTADDLATLVASLVADTVYDGAITTTAPPLMLRFDDTASDAVDEGDGTSWRGTEYGIAYTTPSNRDGSQLVVRADDAAFTPGTSVGFAVGFQADETSTDSVDEGDFGVPRMTLDRRVYTTTADPCSGAKTYYVVDTADGTNLEIANSVASQFFYICSVNLVSAGATVVLISQDDTDGCGSPEAGLAGGSTGTTSEGWSFAANGGLTLGNGTGAVAKTSTAARYLCIDQTASVQLSGTIAYVSAP